jgi:NAD(P)-dependent dehydrogenase (short-subunit alcohol dehydrogenase family)
VLLQDKVVVITGSGGGIGEACARRFSAEGAKVVVADIDGAGAERVARDIGSVGLAADVTVEDEVRALADLARRTYGDIDLWFSNAGVAGPRQPGEVQDNATWESLWALHVMAHVYATRAVLPSMLERGDGYLLQTASVAALATQPDKAAYMVTKHASLALAEWLATTYRPRGIKVSCFCPSAMLTPMLLSNDYPPDHPILQSAAQPAEVADRLVTAIGEERFLIVDSTVGTDALMAKATDFDRWITDVGAMIAAMVEPEKS